MSEHQINDKLLSSEYHKAVADRWENYRKEDSLEMVRFT
jgi:hypothetical protein